MLKELKLSLEKPNNVCLWNISGLFLRKNEQWSFLRTVAKLDKITLASKEMFLNTYFPKKRR